MSESKCGYFFSFLLLSFQFVTTSSDPFVPARGGKSTTAYAVKLSPRLLRSSTLIFDEIVYAAVGTHSVRLDLINQSNKEFTMTIVITRVMVKFGLDSFKLHSGSPGQTAFVTR